MDRLTTMEAFVRVVNAGSFSAAARRWGVSRAVVSKYIAALEGHLGVELLRRTTRALSLTDAGRRYHARCVDVLGEIEALEASLRSDHVQPRGLLRVTAPPGFMTRYGPMMTTGFTERHPGVTMEIHLSHRLVDLVEEGLDLAIRLTAPWDSSLIARKLAPAPLVAVAAPAYLARCGRPQRPADLRHHDCLVDTNFRDLGRWRFRVGRKLETVEVTGPFRINSPTATRDLAIAGHGIALVPGFLTTDALDSGQLIEVLAGMPAFDWSIWAVYPQRRHLAGRVRAFIDYMAEQLSPADG